MARPVHSYLKFFSCCRGTAQEFNANFSSVRKMSTKPPECVVIMDRCVVGKRIVAGEDFKGPAALVHYDIPAEENTYSVEFGCFTYPD